MRQKFGETELPELPEGHYWRVTRALGIPFIKIQRRFYYGPWWIGYTKHETFAVLPPEKYTLEERVYYAAKYLLEDVEAQRKQEDEWKRATS